MSKSRLFRACVAGLTGALLLTGLIAPPAQAYAFNGCKWSTRTLNLDIREVATSNNQASTLKKAVDNYWASTTVNLKAVTTGTNSFRAISGYYGATGWEGRTSYLPCIGGRFSSVTISSNDYYMKGAAATRMKMVWLHEIGHGLGLDHVSTVKRVMYKSSSDAYNAGVTALTDDEISGINKLY